MIHVYTKERHVKKISRFLDSIKVNYKIFIDIDENQSQFDLGVSYCFPKMIKEPLLSKPRLGFVNFHPGPLPKYKGPTELDDAIKNQEIDWGVTVHYMDETYDTGDIIKIQKIKLHEPPIDQKELGSISHYFLFDLFKNIIMDIYNEKVSSTPQNEMK